MIAAAKSNATAIAGCYSCYLMFEGCHGSFALLMALCTTSLEYAHATAKVDEINEFYD